MITRKNILITLLTGSLAFQMGQVAFADVTIDGQLYTDAWIAAHPTEVADYIKNNPTTAAAIVNSSSASTQDAVLNAYNKATGNQMTIDQGRQWAATNAQNAPVVVVNGQAYTDAWIRAHQAEVAAFINANPAQAVSVLQNASASTIQSIVTNDWVKNNKDAVLGFIKSSPNQAASILKNVDATTAKTIIDAYNAKNPGAQITQAQANEWLKQNSAGAEPLSAQWLKDHPGSSDSWYHGGGVNDSQVNAWIAANPNLTPKQIVDAMVMYKIDLRQIMNATHNTNIQPLLDAAAAVGITKEALAQKGILGQMDGATTRNNVWWAVMVGALPKGVFYALQKIDQGAAYNNPEASYSQADMDLAIQLQRNGYYGPTGTGDVSTELAKAGCMNGLVYNEKKCGNGWLGAGAASTGQNIYHPAGTTTGTTGSQTTCPAYTPPAPCTSGQTLVSQGKDSNGCSLPSICVQNTTTYATTTLTNEDTSIVDQACADITYYMSISLTRSPTAAAYLRAQSTDAITEGQVSDLQAFLKDQGYMDQATVTSGRYGSLTTKAIKVLQSKYGFTQTGATGPLTRAKIKELSCQ